MRAGGVSVRVHRVVAAHLLRHAVGEGGGHGLRAGGQDTAGRRGQAHVRRPHPRRVLLVEDASRGRHGHPWRLA